MEVTFLAVVKSFEYKIAISANFVQTLKNSIRQKKNPEISIYTNQIHDSRRLS